MIPPVTVLAVMIPPVPILAVTIPPVPVLAVMIPPVPVAAWSEVSVCGRSLAGIEGSNPAEGMDICLL
jgi:hypothetical protein